MQATVGNRTLFTENAKSGIVMVVLKRNSDYEKVFEKTFATHKNQSNTRDFVNTLTQYDENFIILLITEGLFLFNC